MYTEENMEYNDNYDSQYEENNYDNNGSSIWTLLLRVLIIFLCLLLVIWIVSKFIGGNKKVTNNNDGVVLNNNLDTLRLTGEKYFFIENHLPVKENDTITISLQEFNDKGLVSEIKDEQGKTCSTSSNESYVTVKKTNIAYELIVKLTCANEQKEVTYYYDLESMKCLSCSGNTYMDGNLAIEDSDDTSDDLTEEEINEIEKLNINCNNWSSWTTIKIDDSRLIVKTRTLYKGYKKITDEFNTIYGEWSVWSETPIEANDGIEVETKEEVMPKWSENKTTTDYITNSETIKVISASSTPTSKNCTSSYKQVREEVSASKYFDLMEDGLVITLHDTYYDTECDDDCKTSYKKVYDITYKKKTTSCTGGSSITTYTYQELTQEPVKMYRYRTVTKEEVKEDTIYTDWVEKLEEGYIKTEEKVEYSYKDTTCKG